MQSARRGWTTSKASAWCRARLGDPGGSDQCSAKSIKPEVVKMAEGNNLRRAGTTSTPYRCPHTFAAVAAAALAAGQQPPALQVQLLWQVLLAGKGRHAQPAAQQGRLQPSG